jgi:hypothetical protein
MRPHFGERDLDGELVFDRYLGAGNDLDLLQGLLRKVAPKWSSEMHLWKSPKDQESIDVHHPGALGSAVVMAAAERGATYRALVERHGRPIDERLAGSAELRGAGPELVVIVSLDETVLSRLGARKQLGNRVSLQVRRPRIERLRGDDWLQGTFEAMCSELSPAWAWAGQTAEYWAKVMSDPPRVEAVGRDFGRFLPGLFWLNFFGGRYRELLGDERLRSTPAARVVMVDDGVLVGLASDPLMWDTAGYAADEQRVRDHLGSELFFSKAEPDRWTVAPAWDG